MKVATAIAAHDFQLSIDGFNNIGGGERSADRFRKLQERQVVRSFFAEFADPGGIGLGEAIAEFFKLPVTDPYIPGRFNGSPALLKLKVTSPLNLSITHGHLCIKGRFGFEFVQNREEGTG